MTMPRVGRRGGIAIATILLVSIGVAIRLSATADESTRVISLAPAQDPSPIAPYSGTYLMVDVTSTSGSDYTIETSVSAAGSGYLVQDASITAASAMGSGDKQHLGVNVAGLSTGTVVTVTSKFKDASGGLLDTRQATWTKP